MKNKCLVYTAQFRYNGPDRVDITLKSKDYYADILSPIPSIVWDYKDNKITSSQYTKIYYNVIRERFRRNRDKFYSLISRPCITLVCYCPAKEFCHRLLAAKILVNLGATYMSERIQESKLIWSD